MLGYSREMLRKWADAGLYECVRATPTANRRVPVAEAARLAHHLRLLGEEQALALMPGPPMVKTFCLYRFFSSEKDLLYVGITGLMPHRIDQHSKAKPWWAEVALVTVEHFETHEDVAVAERRAIKAEKPRYNVVHQNATIVERW